jgi:hypothetical protein
MTDVVVLPGGRFGPAAGLLAYAAAVPERRGGTVIRHEWTQTPPDPFRPAAESWVAGEVTSVLDQIEGTPLDTFLDAIGWQPEASRSTD